MIFTAGFALWTAGDDYLLVQTLLGRTLPTLSAMDGLYFGGYALMAAGLMLLSTSRGREGTDMLVDAALVTVGISALVWTTFIDRLGGGASATLLERAVSAAYPGLDILLLALVVRLVIRTRRPCLIRHWLQRPTGHSGQELLCGTPWPECEKSAESVRLP